MKASVYSKYGTPDNLQLKDVEKPTPKDNEVLIKVHAASLNKADDILLRGKPFIIRLMGSGFLKPKYTILGADIAGQIEEVGKNIKRFQPGNEVFGDISECGWGGLAEYVCATEDDLVIKPAGTTFVEAAATPLSSVTALNGLRDQGKIQAGQKVLINGASGGVGTFAIQIAKSFGTEVTGVCSTQKMDMVRSIGADHVIDYTKEDFTEKGQLYDLILAANGYHSISDYKRALKPGGTCVVSGGSGAQLFQAVAMGSLISVFGNIEVRSFESKPNKDNLTFISDLLETGKVVPVVDKCYTLSEVPDAFKYLGKGHASGKVVIQF